MYEYPPLVLCTGAWFDLDKAAKLGFTPDSIKYSFGFFTPDLPDLKNKTEAKEIFWRAYQAQGYSSLEAYFKAIAADIYVTRNLSEIMPMTRSMAYSPYYGHAEQLEKLFFEGGICYVVNLLPESGVDSQRSNDKQMFAIVLLDHSKGEAIKDQSMWRLYAIQNISRTTKSSSGPPAFLPTDVWHFVTVEAERYITTSDKTCVHKGDTQSDYAPETCYADCVTAAFDKNLGYRWFPWEPSNRLENTPKPGNYCNLFDMTGDNASYFDRQRAINGIFSILPRSPDFDLCAQKCSYMCDKTMYTVSSAGYVDEANMSPGNRFIFETAKRTGATGFAMDILHQGFYRGGILTLEEVDTITMAGMITNLGGALGLFVGGTIMTFVQLVLFLLKYCIEQRSKARLAAAARVTYVRERPSFMENEGTIRVVG